MIVPTYSTGFYPGSGQPMHPQLWRDLAGLWAPCLGPTGRTIFGHDGRNFHGTENDLPARWELATGVHQRIPRAYCVNLNITDDTVVIGEVLDNDGTLPQTTFAYAELSSTVSSGSRYIISKQGSSGDFTGWAFWLQNPTGGANANFQYQFRASGSDAIRHKYINENDIPAEAHVYLGTYDGSKAATGIQLYFDGVAVGSTDGDATLTGSSSVAEDLRIGTRNGPSSYFGGRIWIVGVWHRVLSLSEIALLNKDPFAPLRSRHRSPGPAPAAPAGANPKGPLGHPLHGTLAGPVGP